MSKHLTIYNMSLDSLICVKTKIADNDGKAYSVTTIPICIDIKEVDRYIQNCLPLEYTYAAVPIETTQFTDSDLKHLGIDRKDVEEYKEPKAKGNNTVN